MRRWIVGALALFLMAGLAAALVWCSSTERTPRGMVVVSVASAGRGAEEMERDLAIPIEEALRPLEGVELRSISREGVATVSITRTPEPDDALIDAIRTRVAAVSLPDDVDPPVISRASTPVVARWLVVSGEHRAATEVTMERRRRIESLTGVLSVPVCGETEPELRVDLDPARLTAHDISVSDVARAAGMMVALPAGRIDRGGTELAVRSTGGWTASDLGAVQVADRYGAPTRISDLGVVSEGLAEPDCVAWHGGRSIALGVYVMPQAREYALEEIDARAAEAESVRAFGDGARIETGRLLVAVGSSLEERWRVAERLGPELRELPGVADVLLLVEDDATRVVLARETESPSAGELRAVLETVAAHPGVVYVPDGGPLLRVLGPDRGQALEIAVELRERLRRDPALFGAMLSEADAPELAARVDHTRVTDAGVRTREVTEALRVASGQGLRVLTLGRSDRHDVVIRVDVRDRAAAGELRLRGAHGLVRLGDLVTFEHRTAPSRLLRVGGQRCVELEAFGDPSEDIDDTIERIETIARSMDLPPGYTVAVVAP